MAIQRRKPRRAAAAPLGRRKTYVLLAALLLLLAAVLLRTGLFGGARTLPEQVQSDMPRWVEQQLLTPNEYSRPGIAVEEVNAIVIHYVGNPGSTAAENRSYFEGLALSGEAHASSNFVVGLEGEVIQCVPVNEMAYCSSSRNSDTVSIEVCHPDESGEFTEASMESVVRLTAWLCKEFGLTEEDVIRHYDVTGKECPRYYVQNPEAWEALRAAVAAQLESGS